MYTHSLIKINQTTPIMQGMQLPPRQERIWSLLVQICEQRGCIVQVTDPEGLQKHMVSAMSGDKSDDECVLILEALAGNGGVGDATGKCFEIIKQNQKKRDLSAATDDGDDKTDARKAAKCVAKPVSGDKKEDDKAATDEAATGRATRVIFLNHKCVPRLSPDALQTDDQVDMFKDFVYALQQQSRDTMQLHRDGMVELFKRVRMREYAGDDGVFTARSQHLVDVLFNTPSDFFADKATDKFYRPLRLIG